MYVCMHASVLYCVLVCGVCAWVYKVMEVYLWVMDVRTPHVTDVSYLCSALWIMSW